MLFAKSTNLGHVSRVEHLVLVINIVNNLVKDSGRSQLSSQQLLLSNCLRELVILSIFKWVQ